MKIGFTPRSRHSAAVVLVAACAALLIAQTAQATYPGKNGRIALSIDKGNGAQMFTIRHDGTGLSRLTEVRGSALNPDWSPDGSKIVFDFDPTGGTSGCRVEMMNANGTGVVDLTPARIAKHGCAYNPSFTPSGHRIVYVAQRCGACVLAIWSMNLHGGDRHEIAPAPAGDGLHSPRVSPDGKTVVFLAEKDAVVQGVTGNRKALYTVRINGTHRTKIVPFKFDVCSCGADWAPSGDRIVSSDQAGPTPVPGQPSNVFTVRPDGSGLRYLTSYVSPSLNVRAAAGSYSPDGRWVLFKHADFSQGKYVLWKVRPDGTDLTRIGRFTFNFTGRDWGPRGN